jgi:DNA-binding transcriptional MerR regulator/effector-binding domain-containing protein
VFSIGEFSRITGLTVKTLRFYHEEGLLVPSRVDEQTGYRYYAVAKLDATRAIIVLRDLGFSLGEIREILDQVADDADLIEAMERQKSAILGRIKKDRAVVASLDRFITQEREVRRIMTQASFEVEEKDVQSQWIAAVAMKGKYADCGHGFGRIGRSLGRQICGKPFLLHYDREYRENDASFEACFPIRSNRSAEGISVRELPGGRCVSLLHKGPYSELGRSYAKIVQYLHDHGYEASIPTREIYHKGPGMIFKGNPRNYLTEIQMFVQEQPERPEGNP